MYYPGVCPEEDKERAKSDQNCGFLLSDSSPFKACKDSKTVDFNKMYSSCEFDGTDPWISCVSASKIIKK
jgi:hypothetical protein